MNPAASSLARKYAVAFLNVAGGAFGSEDFSKLADVTEYIRAHREFTLFLSLPIVKKQIVSQVLDKLFTTFKTKELLLKLVGLLLQQHRIFLLSDVLHHISDIYKQRLCIVQFQCTSSHELDAQQKSAITAYLARVTGKQILDTFRVDPALIAGLRLQSDTLLWEHSVKKQLLRAQQALKA